jgi:ribosomal protein S15P/S13E
MYLTADTKKEFFTENGKNEFDTGSAEGQVALFTFIIKQI